nr:NepR family anti-sigma factor [Methylobacterium brachythecii]
MPSATQISNSGRPLGKQAHRRIGANLRTMYQSIVQQPIPSRFSDLIAKLDEDSAVTADQP